MNWEVDASEFSGPTKPETWASPVQPGRASIPRAFSNLFDIGLDKSLIAQKA